MLRLQKWEYSLLASLAILLSVSAACVIKSQAHGDYEQSIYNLPIVVWVLLIGGFVLSVFLIVADLKNIDSPKRWLFALGALVVNGIVVLTLPILKGYYAMSNGDILAHIGYVKDMMTGHLSTGNIYPGLHIIPTFLSWLGTPVEIAVGLLPAIFYVIYIVSFYLLSQMLFKERRQAMLATTLSALLLLPNYGVVAAVYPSALILPLVLLCLIRTWERFCFKNVVLLLGIVAVAGFLHPLSGVFIIVTVAVSLLIHYKGEAKMATLGVAFVVGVPAIVWFFVSGVDYVPMCVEGGKLIFFNITSFSTPSTLSTPSNVAAPLTLLGTADSSTSLVLLALKRYGGELVLGALTVLSVVVVIKRYFKKQGVGHERIYVIFLFGVVFIMWFVGWYFGSGSVGCLEILGRMMYWLPMLAIVVAVPVLSRVASKQSVLSISLLFVLIVGIGIPTMMNKYPSPYTELPNGQITYKQMHAMEWLLENRELEQEIVLLGNTPMYRYRSAIYGRDGFWKSQQSGNVGTDNSSYYFVIFKKDRVEADKISIPSSLPVLVYKDGDEVEIWHIKRD